MYFLTCGYFPEFINWWPENEDTKESAFQVSLTQHYAKGLVLACKMSTYQKVKQRVLCSVSTVPVMQKHMHIYELQKYGQGSIAYELKPL